MKFSVLAIAAIFSLAAAQNLSGEPACATSCLLSAISAASCAPTDVSCQCGLSAAVVGPCLIGACNATDLQIALTVGTNLCKAYSATATNTALTTTNTALATALNTTILTSSTAKSNLTTSSVIKTKTAAQTTASAAATTEPAVLTTGNIGGSSPSTSTSKAGAPALMAAMGGVVGMLGVVAVL
ncbi:hypothetical protein L207DRAFT_577543 [Hyaloscypha variabilis F]|uniref:CFEM domain-containing protein n=1 Tax=Hyaloscypha variabilis (strain UAMH 11265 / GT02V1 / F) TaxID=1149755 RepID=A0A2J6S7G1_HYAVF|nr:hypothetical protein L207DRAFT_577543 [Hyaloscypha variabilis F]